MLLWRAKRVVAGELLFFAACSSEGELNLFLNKVYSFTMNKVLKFLRNMHTKTRCILIN